MKITTMFPRDEEGGEEEQPASPNSILMHAPNFNISILTVMGSATTIDVIYLKKCLEQTLVKHPRFSSILIVKDPKHYKFSWKRAKVDMDNHVFVPILDPKLEFGDEVVEDYMSQLSTFPVDLSKPLWELHVLNVKTRNSNATVIMKIHHSMGDGVSLISVILACAKKISDPESLPVLPSRRTNKLVSRNNGRMKKIFMLLWRVMMVIYYTLIDSIEFMATLLFFKDTDTIIKGGKNVKTSTKRYVHRVMSLDDVKIIKNAMKVTVNEVIFGITEATISRYLLRAYVLEKCKQNGENRAGLPTDNVLPKRLRIRTVVAINLRKSATIQDMADVMEKEMKMEKKMWGNLVGFVLLPLRICAHDDDPLIYVRRAKALMHRKKLSLQPLIMYHIVNLFVKTFGIKVAAALVNRFFGNVTLGFSSVVGPEDEITIFSYPVTYVAPTVSGFHAPLIIHHQSYANKLVVSMVVDEKQIPDPHQLCDDFNYSLQTMKDAALKKMAPT